MSRDEYNKLPDDVDLGGYSQLQAYRDRFKAEYVDGEPLIDVRGMRIYFNGRRPNRWKDVEHAIFGKSGIYGINETMWDRKAHDRARKLTNWIRHVVTNPSVKILKCVNDSPPGQMQYIYMWGMSASGVRPQTSYVVCVTEYDDEPGILRFVTGYPVNPAGWGNKSKLYETIYPVRTKKAQETTTVTSLQITTVTESLVISDEPVTPAIKTEVKTLEVSEVRTSIEPYNPRKARKQKRKGA